MPFHTTSKPENICQDRLGTNVGKAALNKKRCVCKQRLAFARGIGRISQGRLASSGEDAAAATAGGTVPNARHARTLFQTLTSHIRSAYTQRTYDEASGSPRSTLGPQAQELLARIGEHLQCPGDQVVTEAASRAHSSSWQVRLQWAVGVAKGLTYLHSRQIVHSDLKADNILLAPGNVAKLCDFSFSQLRAFGQEETSAVGDNGLFKAIRA
jgi:hypothetical protein